MKRKHLPNLLGIITAFAIGLGGPFFGLWQFDLMCCGKVWGDPGSNVIFYQNLYNAGYSSFAASPWTINAEFFPNMTAGVAYDFLLGLIITSSVLALVILLISIWTWED
jgi:hypothetical protein